MTNQDWPFDDPPNRRCYTTVNVLENDDPILVVTHDADDPAWQFLCGTTSDPEDGRVIGLDCAFARDLSLSEVADLPLGWRDWRDEVGGPWTRAPRSVVDDDDEDIAN